MEETKKEKAPAEMLVYCVRENVRQKVLLAILNERKKYYQEEIVALDKKDLKTADQKRAISFALHKLQEKIKGLNLELKRNE